MKIQPRPRQAGTDPKQPSTGYSSVDIVHFLTCFHVAENAVTRFGRLPWDVYSNKLCENSRPLFACIDSDIDPLDELIAAITEVVKPFTIPFGNMSDFHIPSLPTG